MRPKIFLDSPAALESPIILDDGHMTNDLNAIDIVPDDFPRPEMASGLAGAQPKISAVMFEGKFYVPGGTPPERLASWEGCEDLAKQFAEKCRRNEKGKYEHLSRTEILAQYCDRLLQTDFGSAAEMRWVIRRTAELLSWPVPPNAMV